MTMRRNVIGAVASVPLATCVALACASGTAQAATMKRPTAIMAFASSSITAGTTPVLTFVTTGAPRGSAIYLERASSVGQPWRSVGQVKAANGTVRAPADPAGQYQYRIVITSDGTALAVSTPESLTVTVGPGHCSVCNVVKDAYRIAKQIIPGILAIIITDFFGF